MVPEGEVRLIDRSPRRGCVIVIRTTTCSRKITWWLWLSVHPVALYTERTTCSGRIVLEEPIRKGRHEKKTYRERERSTGALIT